MWSVKQKDFARDDNNKLSLDNQKLLIFSKTDFQRTLHIVRYSS